MANKLLIRLYNVGLGDCIYVRIPAAGNNSNDFHMLIDCGTLGEKKLVENAINHLETNMLPPVGNTNKKRLDLLVATHPHKDHIIGFNPDVFKNIKIENIWLSPIMNPKHKQAENTHSLQTHTAQAVQGIMDRGLSLGPDLALLASLFGLDRDGAEKALRETIPGANEIVPKYVYAGQTSDDKEIKLALPNAKITVVGPENNIDYFYLGKDEAASFQGLQKFSNTFAAHSSGKKTPRPANISAHDFEVLQTRMLSNAFAFANLSSEVENNSSIVLLLEWNKKRLLFVGDAEWDEQFKEGKGNASWNVMWNKRKDLLNKPIQFLKIGHHGSVNATPWLANEDGSHEVNQILNAILPIPAKGTPKAQAVVSTKRSNYDVIPDTSLLVELGKRVKNQRRYQSTFAKIPGFQFNSIPLFVEKEQANLDKKQPMRTDFETLLKKGEFIDINIGTS